MGFIVEHGVELLDIALSSVAIYYILLFLRAARSYSLVKGLGLLAVLYVVCQYFRFVTLAFIFERLLLIVALLFLIVFAPELRKYLEGLGRTSTFWRQMVPDQVQPEHYDESDVLVTVCETAEELARNKHGAIFVFRQTEAVRPHIISGTPLDAVVSSRLLQSVFNPHNPLHDGAVLVESDRVAEAGCFLPISEWTALPETLGTRHRAAIGLTERVDAVVAVVSEERGSLSIAHQGRLALDLTPSQFREQLGALLAHNDDYSTQPSARAGLI